MNKPLIIFPNKKIKTMDFCEIYRNITSVNRHQSFTQIWTLMKIFTVEQFTV